ncbi:hypothetical protein CEY16_13820 [Halalkalibacillus sediminis]|uniref:STAS domain-containing protein n=1 Tax=Halalkalibacillus sediminis TaxID=2018042 RepID=A0A2I0QRD1_9BACI|nr:STAS domain-containing protein [Halalkalibacillus sediminis]PKR76883.1 hypothetical protein CEY16_13820 [Halalkalibacillus sediminis]
MKINLTIVGKTITKNRSSITDKILYSLDSQPKKLFYEASNDRSLMEGLIHTIGGRLEYGDRYYSFSRIQDIGREAGSESLHNEEMLHLTFTIITYVSEHIWNMLETSEVKELLTKEDIMYVHKEIETTILQLMIGYVNSFIKLYKKASEEADNEVNELSVPIIKIDDHIGVCPVIGKLSSNRAAVLMDQTLRKAAIEEYEYLILDLSGLVVVDNLVAKYLFDTVYSMELIGIKVIFTGVRAQLAMASVNLEFDLAKQKTYSNVKQALKSLNTTQK